MNLPIKIELPPRFLDEEVRCDYTVSREMKEVWAVELDLLCEFDRVCRKHDIKYFADGGTILGAVRHGGFIPWDDDIDIAMMRSEYDKLCAVADEFTAPYFFQTQYTDPGSLRGHAQIRNCLTTGALNYETKYCWHNQGIFIDIFPIDCIPSDRAVFEKQRERIELLKKRAKFWALSVGNYELSHGIKRFGKVVVNSTLVALGLKDKLINCNYDEFERLCKKYNDTDAEMCSLLCHQAKWDRLIRSKSDYSESVDKEFEFLKIPLPIGYENVLRNLYGDYNVISKGTSSHGEVIFDARVPYNVLLKEKYGNRYY